MLWAHRDSTEREKSLPQDLVIDFLGYGISYFILNDVWQLGHLRKEKQYKHVLINGMKTTKQQKEIFSQYAHYL